MRGNILNIIQAYALLLRRTRRTEQGAWPERWRGVSIPELFQKYRFYVACEADEDIAYLAQYAGEENLIIGSDYGHRDPSEERELVATMRSREDAPSRMIDKILSDNPRRFYAV